MSLNIEFAVILNSYSDLSAPVSNGMELAPFPLLIQ